uniref:sugar O-acetyltransferase n=1 Tax=Marinobacterium profundum TaxID=1714300 RepID=UPI0008338FBF|nr:sugar O-acetyltransferase [Marinobacterium profundum]
MNEKEKMLAGLPFDPRDPVLVGYRLGAKSVCHRFNMADPADLEDRMMLLAGLLRLKGAAHIEPNFFCDYGFNIYIGDGFYSNHNLTILDVCRVDIGSKVMFGPNVLLSGATHPVDPVERMSNEYGAPIKIGDNSWLGGNVVVLPGITIGNNCVVGAGSVVTRDLPDNVVAAGNPCRVIRSV